MSGNGTAARHHDGADIATVAATFAGRDAEEAEAAIEALVTEAIHQWHLDKATFWQRVKFRARMLRAARDGAARHRTGQTMTC